MNRSIPSGPARRRFVLCMALFLLAATFFLSGCIDQKTTISDSRLRLITLSGGQLQPPFSPDIRHYQSELDEDAETVRITPFAQNAKAVIRINGKIARESLPSAPIALNPGKNTVTIEVVSSDGANRSEYRVDVYRGKIPPDDVIGGNDDGQPGSPGTGDASLSALAILETRLDQTFQSSQRDYTASVGPLVDSVRIVATAGAGATLAINGVGAASGVASEPIPLKDGANQIEIVVSSADNKTSDRYTIEVLRQSIDNFGSGLRLRASRPEKGAQFGFSAALSGDQLAIGAPRELNDGGAVYLFSRGAAGWRASQRLALPDRTSGNRFGQSLAMQGDTLIVGAMQRPVDGKFNAGEVYVFMRQNGQWRQTGKLTAPSPQTGHRFGYAVALDGDWLAVATLRGDNDEQADSGQVFIFRRQGSAWTLQAAVGEPGQGASDKYAASIDLDGDLLAVGAFRQPDCRDTDDPDPGQVRIYQRQGTRWTLSQTLGGEGANDRFGFSVALDNGRLAVGAQCEDENHTTLTEGAVYVYQRDGGQFRLQQKLKAFQTGEYSLYGDRVAWSGERLIVTGSWEIPRHNKNSSLEGAGAAYLIARENNRWIEKRLFLPDAIDAFDRFGISLSVDAGRALIGAPGNETGDPSQGKIGAAWIFE
ncbi:MAG TPA: hypothetical protein ENK26_12330 [Gammaproteobacteria bacterium]|nr:hypothetical protein [Gammaproteobacteria bacterium]